MADLFRLVTWPRDPTKKWVPPPFYRSSSSLNAQSSAPSQRVSFRNQSYSAVSVISRSIPVSVNCWFSKQCVSGLHCIARSSTIQTQAGAFSSSFLSLCKIQSYARLPLIKLLCVTSRNHDSILKTPSRHLKAIYWREHPVCPMFMSEPQTKSVLLNMNFSLQAIICVSVFILLCVTSVDQGTLWGTLNFWLNFQTSEKEKYK